MTILTMIVLVIGSFAATNVDNLIILVGWMLSGQVSRTRLFAGYVLGTASMLLIAAGLGYTSGALPVEYIGLLGVIPIGMGVYSLAGLVRDASDDVEITASGNVAVLATALTLLANSIDTIFVLSPLLADSERQIDYFIMAGFAVTALAWFVLAHSLSRYAAQLHTVSKVARWLAPVIMIIVGLYILDNTATDIIPGH